MVYEFGKNESIVEPESPDPQNDRTSLAEESVRTILRFIGEDPLRNGLKDTPARVVKSWLELTAGYGESPEKILSRTFDEHHDEMIILRGIEFTSVCEHHLLPFIGVATVAYIPGFVVGISKLARVVHCFSKRLQIQERMTQQIAQAIELYLQAVGVGVVVKARHLCMECRGVKQSSVDMITSCLLGAMKTNRDARSELIGFL